MFYSSISYGFGISCKVCFTPHSSGTPQNGDPGAPKCCCSYSTSKTSASSQLAFPPFWLQSNRPLPYLYQLCVTRAQVSNPGSGGTGLVSEKCCHLHSEPPDYFCDCSNLVEVLTRGKSDLQICNKSRGLGLRTQNFSVVGLGIHTVEMSGPIHTDKGMSAPNLSANSSDEVQLRAHPSF